jgi:hypothetical protein
MPYAEIINFRVLTGFRAKGETANLHRHHPAQRFFRRSEEPTLAEVEGNHAPIAVAPLLVIGITLANRRCHPFSSSARVSLSLLLFALRGAARAYL